MTIDEARDAAATILRQVRDGQDPTVERKARNAAITVNELIAIYLVEGRFAKPNKRGRPGDQTPPLSGRTSSR